MTLFEHNHVALATCFDENGHLGDEICILLTSKRSRGRQDEKAVAVFADEDEIGTTLKAKQTSARRGYFDEEEQI